MIDPGLYIIVGILFLLHFIGFSKNPKKQSAVKIIVSYLLVLKFIYGDPVIRHSINAIFSSLDHFIFALSGIAVLLFFILIFWTLTRHVSAYNPFLVFLSFLMGILSTRIVTDIYTVFDHFTILTIQYMSVILQLRYSLSESLIYQHLSILIFSLFVGIVEEFAKFALFLALIYFLIEKKDKYNIILYLCFTALGFSLIENIYYSLEFGQYIRIMRNIFAGHLIFALFMGYFIYKINYSLIAYKRVFYIMYCFFFVVLMHTTWNFLSFISLFNIHANIIFYVFYAVISIASLYLVIHREKT